MKFRNVFLISREYYGAISGITQQAITVNGRSGSRVFGWNNAVGAVTKLLEIPLFEREASELIERIPSFYRTSKIFDVSNEEWNKISKAQMTLLKKMENVIEIYQMTGQEMEEKCGVDIKLPQYSDFSEFAKYISDLELIFTKCPFIKNEEEKLEFENVDIGSTWLTFFVVGSVAVVGGSILLNNIAAFIDKCIVIRSHYLTIQKQKVDLDKEKRTEEEKKVILKYIEEMYMKNVDFEMQELENLTHVTLKDPEERSRALLTINKMGELIDKGLQVCASLNSPSETKALFEPLEMKYIEISKGLKLLEEKNT